MGVSARPQVCKGFPAPHRQQEPQAAGAAGSCDYHWVLGTRFRISTLNHGAFSSFYNNNLKMILYSLRESLAREGHPHPGRKMTGCTQRLHRPVTPALRRLKQPVWSWSYITRLCLQKLTERGGGRERNRGGRKGRAKKRGRRESCKETLPLHVSFLLSFA